jgi:hypothetical protein
MTLRVCEIAVFELVLHEAHGLQARLMTRGKARWVTPKLGLYLTYKNQRVTASVVKVAITDFPKLEDSPLIGKGDIYGNSVHATFSRRRKLTVGDAT